MLSHPDFNRIEDSSLILSEKGNDYKDLIVATRNEASTYAMFYLPQPNAITIDLTKLKKGNKKAYWFNPVSGKSILLKNKYNTGEATFYPPSNKQRDWVLVIDVV